MNRVVFTNGLLKVCITFYALVFIGCGKDTGTPTITILGVPQINQYLTYSTSGGKNWTTFTWTFAENTNGLNESPVSSAFVEGDTFLITPTTAGKFNTAYSRPMEGKYVRVSAWCTDTEPAIRVYSDWVGPIQW